MPAAPYDVPPAPDIPGISASHDFDIGSSDAGDSTSATTSRGKPGVTTARSPMLAVDDATKGRHGGIVGHAADQRVTGTDDVRLLSPSHQKERGSGIIQRPTPYAYQEDNSKKEQWRAFLDEGYTPPVPDEDIPTIMDATTPASSEDGGTNKTSSK
jgi:hypothetical protein